MDHQAANLLFGGPGFDLGLVGYVSSRLTHSSELTRHFDTNHLNLDPALCSFTVDIVAVARGDRQEEQFASVRL
jgi:hypothetical protein